MEGIVSWLEDVKGVLQVPVFEFGGSQVTIWSLIYIVVLIALLFYVAGLLRLLIVRRLLARSSLDRGAREAIGTITRYVVLLIGLLVIVQTAGINLTTLNVLAGAVGIGIGFGLQNVVNNFVSGLIVMFERPIKIGDRIVVDDIDGDVIEIGARSTKVLTNDNIAIIVPNSKFITENVVNWKYSDDTVRFRIPVAVAYGSDARLVEKILLEVAKQNEDVLENPPPGVRLLAFGDNGLEFELRAWTNTQTHRKGRLVSSLNFAIYDKFNEAGIVFPFPQRDLHVRGGSLEVSVSGKDKGTSK